LKSGVSGDVTALSGDRPFVRFGRQLHGRDLEDARLLLEVVQLRIGRGLVDPQDQAIGTLSKFACHQGDGVLHRAFSLFVFNRSGELLLQQRSAEKPLWPLYWSNSCCSHPRQSESINSAAQRRIREELGFSCDFNYLYKFSYHARYRDLGSERELCHVLAGCSEAPVQANREEVAAWRYISPQQLDQEMQEHPNQFTPWFKMEWQRVSQQHLAQILKRCARL